MRLTLALTAAALAVGCHHRANRPESGATVMREVTRGGGWRPLFDGRTVDGWRRYEADSAPRGWSAVDGMLVKGPRAGDLMTKEQFANFELELEWKIGKAGNSGIFYRGTREYDHIYWSAPEYQLEDDVNAADNKTLDRRSGANYALMAAPEGHVKPFDEWNTTRLVVNGAHVEHWLNGYKLLEYELWSPQWKALVAASKFNDWPNYGMAKKGYIAIQGDHPGTLALRNIRIRELP